MQFGPMKNERTSHLKEFYSLLGQLQKSVHGPRRLADCKGQMSWPLRGVYFFLEEGEGRTDTGSGPRVVRVGTHALQAGSNTRLWTRLSQHRGQKTHGGGNHRGSIFRLLVGNSLSNRKGQVIASWGQGSSAPSDVRAGESGLEKEVSRVIGSMAVLWLGIDDDPGPKSLRGYVERNAIALLSNYKKQTLDPPSQAWLGQYCDRERVRNSGLWNSNHVDEVYDQNFLEVFQRLVSEVEDAT
jgi:hypothetical protein